MLSKAGACASIYDPSLLSFLLAFACRFDLQFGKKVDFINVLLVSISLLPLIWSTKAIFVTLIEVWEYSEIWDKLLFMPWYSKSFCLLRFQYTKMIRHIKNDLVPEDFLLSSGTFFRGTTDDIDERFMVHPRKGLGPPQAGYFW